MLTFSTIAINVRVCPPLTVHDGMTPPPAFPLVKLPHVEVPHTMLWGFGQDFTTKTLFNNFTVARQGNDAGIGIIHVSIPPVNPLLPLTIATSAYKCMFGAATTLVEGKPAATFFPGIAPGLACAAPVPWPCGMFVPLPNTVFIGMSFWDFVAGWARTIAAIGIAALMAKFGGKIPGFDKIGKLGAKLGGKLGSKIGEKLATRLGEEMGKAIAEDIFKGLVLSPIVSGKIEAPFQIGELNLWTGETKFFTEEGPRLYEGADREYGSVMGGIGWADSAIQQPSADPTQGAADGLPSAGGSTSGGSTQGGDGGSSSGGSTQDGDGGSSSGGSTQGG